MIEPGSCLAKAEAEVKIGEVKSKAAAAIKRKYGVQTSGMEDIHSTTGQDMSALDSSFVLDTCGAGSTLPRSSDEGFGILMVTTGSRVDWGSTAVSASGGEYCLCLCTMECDLQLKQLVRKEKKSPIQHFLNQCSTTTRLCTLVTKATQQMKVPGLQTPSGIRDARNQV